MLIMFRAKNYTSFKEDVILDLRQTSYREHSNHVFEHGDFNLLKTTVIYGANASGKSNLISAISSYKDFILNQLFSSKDNDIDSDILINNKIPIEPFLLGENVEKEMEFEMIFSYKNIMYQYGYSIEEENICTEWLYVNNELVYDRKKSHIEYGKKYSSVLSQYKKVREDRLYISILDYFVVEDNLKLIIDTFKEYFRVQLNVYFEIFFQSSIKGISSYTGFHKEIIENESFRKKVSEYINKIDVGIREIVVDRVTMTNKRTGEKEDKFVLKSIHDVYDTKGNIVGKKDFDLRYESSGTLRFLSFIQEILKMMERGGIFVADELSSRLHTFLTKFIVDMFQSDLNKMNAQLIFTTHDISLMNKEQFRRDEVVLVDKNKEGASTIYTLADLGVRKDATFNKDYFKGKFGAIPIVNIF